jgi:hypothetical protein
MNKAGGVQILHVVRGAMRERILQPWRSLAGIVGAGILSRRSVEVPCLLQVNAWTIRAAEGAQGSESWTGNGRRTRFAKVANSVFNATPPSRPPIWGRTEDGELSNAELKDPSALGFK